MGPWTQKLRGKGPQQLMHEAKKTAHGDLRFFAEDVNNKGIKRYYLFTSEALEKVIKNYELKKRVKTCYKHLVQDSI